jgi:antitoxin (DNA-binding transcriptional repressor) of toxin-antitoxin stability system
MAVAPRDLRNSYGDLLARAEGGEYVDVVRDGRVIATLGPPRQPAGTSRGRLLDVFRTSEPVDVDRFFDDVYGREGLDDTLADPMDNRREPA